MTGLQFALASGLLFGSAFALLAWRLAPSDPDLADAFDRLSPDYQARRRAAMGADADGTPQPRSLYDSIGAWAMKNLPAAAWARTPRKDLAILQVSETRFYGEKVIWALMGLALPPLVAAFFGLIGLPLPVSIPTLGSVACAVLFFFIPNYNAADDAKKARIEFHRALGAYIELVALERKSGASGQQALAAAAEVGDSWVFRLLHRELRRARYMSRAPWDSLQALAKEIDVPELDDLADIMQLSGQDGAQIYTNLRARAAAMRSAMLSAEVAKANATAERMYLPASMVGVVFLAILVAPALLRIQGGG